MNKFEEKDELYNAEEEDKRVIEDDDNFEGPDYK